MTFDRDGAAYPIPSAPVLLVSALEDAGHERLCQACKIFGWPYVTETDEHRVGWAASVHRPSAVIIQADEARWTVRMVTTVRNATAGALVVVGDLSSAHALSALRGGADAIVPAGVTDEECLAQVYAVIRRIREVLAPSTRYLLAGQLRVDLWQRTVQLDCAPIHLTGTEFDLLAHLMRNAERVLEPSSIVPRVWGCPTTDGLNTLRIFIGRLRHKLGDDARHPTVVKSIRGYGYRFAIPVIEVPDEDRAGLVPNQRIELLDALATIASALGGCSDESALAEVFVGELAQLRIADAIALHRVVGDTLQLLAHHGLSERWLRAVSPSIPLYDGYASGHAVRSATPIQLLARTGRGHRDSHQALSDEDSQSSLFLPITASDQTYGCLGLVRATPDSHDSSTLAFLKAACAVYGTRIGKPAVQF